MMLEAIVTNVFVKETATGSDSLPFFNGQTPCKSRDFVGDAIIRTALARSLVAFFGSSGVLGCTQSGFPQFNGNPNMEEVHQFMPITKAIFDGFNSNLVAAVKEELSDLKTLDEDLKPVAALLGSPAITAICNQEGCPGTKGAFMTKKACVTTTGTAGTPGASGTPGTPGTGTTGSTASNGGSVTPSTTGTTTTKVDLSSASSVAMAVAVAMVAVVAQF